MKTKHFATALLAIAVIGIVVHQLRKKDNVSKRLEDVADAGYETAHDILYPLSKRKLRSW